MVRAAHHVIAVHGCTVIEPKVYLGGLDTELIDQIQKELSALRLDSEYSSKRLSGTHQLNICNRGKSRRGVQLELSRGVRDSEALRAQVTRAVQSALEKRKNRERQGSYLSRKC
jgi:phage replication-related protein YjqB (UPF0714/DUF867 family)